MPHTRGSRWTMPGLRIGMGIFLVAWELDKLLATEGSVGIFSRFFGDGVDDARPHPTAVP